MRSPSHFVAHSATQSMEGQMNRSSFLISICLVTIAGASCSGDKKLELGGS